MNCDEIFIGIFNKPSCKFILKGPLKNQAYKLFFYGKDEKVEDLLSKIEGSCAKSIKSTIRTNNLPNINSEDYLNLRFFTFLQNVKTAEKVRQDEESMYKMIQKILSFFPETKDKYKDLTMGFENPAGANVESMLNNFYMTLDLRCKLLINQTSIPFIVSDHPVVRYNQLMEEHTKPGCHTGLATKGLQVFIPISPLLMLAYYDSKIYKIANKKDCECVLTNRDDVFQLNGLQFLNTDKNLYFNHQINNSEITKLKNTFEKYDSLEKAGIKEYENWRKEDGTTSKIIHGFP